MCILCASFDVAVSTCPNGCSSRGKCKSIAELGLTEAGPLQVTYSNWEQASVSQCVCDSGWAGPDCSQGWCCFIANVNNANWLGFVFGLPLCWIWSGFGRTDKYWAFFPLEYVKRSSDWGLFSFGAYASVDALVEVGCTCAGSILTKVGEWVLIACT